MARGATVCALACALLGAVGCGSKTASTKTARIPGTSVYEMELDKLASGCGESPQALQAHVVAAYGEVLRHKPHVRPPPLVQNLDALTTKARARGEIVRVCPGLLRAMVTSFEKHPNQPTYGKNPLVIR